MGAENLWSMKAWKSLGIPLSFSTIKGPAIFLKKYLSKLCGKIQIYIYI